MSPPATVINKDWEFADGLTEIVAQEHPTTGLATCEEDEVRFVLSRERGWKHTRGPEDETDDGTMSAPNAYVELRQLSRALFDSFIEVRRRTQHKTYAYFKNFGHILDGKPCTFWRDCSFRHGDGQRPIL